MSGWPMAASRAATTSSKGRGDFRLKRCTEISLVAMVHSISRILCGESQFSDLAGVNLEGGGGDIFFEVRNARCSGNRKHHGRSGEQPRQRDLKGSRFRLRSKATEWAIGAGDFAGGEWEPRNESQVVLFAILEDRFRAAVGQA